MNNYQKVAQALNSAFMTDEPYMFVAMLDAHSISIAPKPSSFVKHTTINYLTEEGKQKITDFLKEKYNVKPTFHHNHSFGIYDEHGEYAKFDA